LPSVGKYATSQDSIRATIIDLTYDDISSICSISQADRGDYQNFFVPLVFPHSCHERRTSRPGRKAKVEGSLIRLFKAKEGSRKHEALACLNILGSPT